MLRLLWSKRIYSSSSHIFSDHGLEDQTFRTLMHQAMFGEPSISSVAYKFADREDLVPWLRRGVLRTSATHIGTV
jgi:hypothetical protein